jgi:hypothetical protein
MKNRQYESMTRVPLTYWTVRVWCTEPCYRLGPSPEIATAVLDAATKSKYTGDVPVDVALALDRIENVAAYEIVDLNGNGAVVYTDWP